MNFYVKWFVLIPLFLFFILVGIVTGLHVFSPESSQSKIGSAIGGVCAIGFGIFGIQHFGKK